MRARSVVQVVLAVAVLGAVAGCRGDRSDLMGPSTSDHYGSFTQL